MVIMKREFLKSLGLESDVIDKVMDEAGKDINKLKQDNEKVKEELTTVKGQLEEANTTIESYKGMDIEGIKQSVEDWKTKYESDTKALQDQLASKDYEFNAKEYLSKFKFTSDLAKNAVIADFKAKNFKLENGTFLGADDYMKQLQESNPGAFVSEEVNEPLPNLVKPTNNNPGNVGRMYTRAEIEKMTPEQINNNWPDIQASLAKL